MAVDLNMMTLLAKYKRSRRPNSHEVISYNHSKDKTVRKYPQIEKLLNPSFILGEYENFCTTGNCDDMGNNDDFSTIGNIGKVSNIGNFGNIWNVGNVDNFGNSGKTGSFGNVRDFGNIGKHL
jgi:hypothetical protein